MGESLKTHLLRGLKLRCPSCGVGRLYRSFLKVNDTCASCSFALKDHDAADGPAYVVMCLMGVKVIALAFLLEYVVQPPMWVHMVIWLPVTILGSLVLLIFVKSLFIAVQYHYQVEGFGKS